MVTNRPSGEVSLVATSGHEGAILDLEGRDLFRFDARGRVLSK